MPSLSELTREQLRSALESAGSLRGAARALELPWGSRVRNALTSVALGRAQPPVGFVPKKITTDRKGKPTAVQSVPEAPEDERKPVVPADHYVKGISSYLNSEGEVAAQWVKTDQQKATADDARFEAIEQHLARHDRLSEEYAPLQVRDTGPDELCNFVVFGDPHFGMLAHGRETGAADWDLKIANDVMISSLRRLLQRLPAAGSFVLINIGDFFHFENNTQLTPRSGHKLDGDTRFVKVAEAGCTLQAALVDIMLGQHESGTLFNVAGNHDPDAARWLNLWCRARFRGCDRLRIPDNAAPYLYHRFGANLIGMHHGDGRKLEKLPLLMASERPLDWGETQYRRWVTGHHHTYRGEDIDGCLVEKFPTLAPLDYYAAHAGYRSERALHAFTLHEKEGEISRCKVLACEVG